MSFLLDIPVGDWLRAYKVVKVLLCYYIMGFHYFGLVFNLTKSRPKPKTLCITNVSKMLCRFFDIKFFC